MDKIVCYKCKRENKYYVKSKYRFCNALNCDALLEFRDEEKLRQLVEEINRLRDKGAEDEPI